MRAFISTVLAALVMLLFCFAGCDKPTKRSQNHAGAKAARPTEPERPLLPEEKERLAELELQLSELKLLVRNMKGVVDDLKNRDRSEKAFERQTRSLSPAALKALLAEAKAGMKTSPEGIALSKKAKEIDSALKASMTEAKLDAEAPIQLRRTRDQIDELQRTIQQLAPGTNAAFRAHALLIQSELALKFLAQKSK